MKILKSVYEVIADMWDDIDKQAMLLSICVGIIVWGVLILIFGGAQ